MSDDHGVRFDAKPPFSFGLGEQGELIVSWVQGELQGGVILRMHLVIPPEEVAILRRGLEESKTIQETLSAKRPPPGAH